MYDILMEVLPIIATIFLTVCYVPQIIKIHRTKDVTSQSLWFWILLCIALGLMFTNAFMIFATFGTFGYLITETMNLGLAMTVLCQVFRYRKKK